MSQTGPWSVKGIDQRARDAAREAAMAEGITLGEYLNRLLMSADEAEHYELRDPYYEGPSYGTGRQRTPPRHPQQRDPRQDPANVLERLSRRIEATEARSTLAITGIDQTVLGLVARLDNSEQTTAAIAGHVEGVIEEMRATHEALQAKVRRLEQDESGKENLETLKALEAALGKLAAHVYEEAELAEAETTAIKGRIEAGFSDLTDRFEGLETRVGRSLSEAAAKAGQAVDEAAARAETVTRPLADRLETLEADLKERGAEEAETEARLASLEGDVSGAITSMEATLLRVQERLNRAETTTDAALKGLESTFAHLDERIDAVASSVEPDLAERLRSEFEARFEDMTQLVRSVVDNTRRELAQEIARTAEQESETVTKLRGEVSELNARLAEVEARDPEEMTAGVRAEISQLSETVTQRMDALADQVETRIEESELRSADAIEQVGEQVTVAAVRLQKRQDEALAALAEEINAGRQSMDARLSDALASVSERLEDIHTESANALSPVQRAIAALASRLESVEAFTAPPGQPLPPPISAGTPPAEETRPAPHKPQPEARAYPDEADEDDLLTDEAPVEAATGPAGETNWDDTETEAEAEAAPADFADDGGIFDFLEDSVAGDETLAEAGAPESQADSFQTGLTDWDEADAEDGDDSPYEADFEAIRAAAARIGGTGELEDFDELEDEDAGGTSFDAGLPQADDAGDEFDDPLSELAGLEEARTEARESDIFDEEDETGPFIAETSPEADESELIETLEAAGPSKLDETTSDYLARARRAALAASENQGRGPRQAGQKRGPSKTPLYIAASAVVLTGAGAGGYLYLRGKQAPEPAISSPVDTYVDPQLAAAPPSELAAYAAEYAGDEASAEPVAGDFAIDTFALLTDEAGPSVAEDDIFDDAAAAEPDSALTSGGARPAELEAMGGPSVQMAALSAVRYPPIPPVVTVEAEANAGNGIAQYQLAVTKRADGNLAEAIPLLRRSALKGIAPAQYELGKHFERGEGVDLDLVQARHLIGQAAEAGHVGAMYDYALFLAEGEGGPANEPEAVRWFTRAAEHGFVDAQYNLGVVHAEGMGTSRDLAEALYWFELARRAGDSGADLEVRNLSARLPEDTVIDILEAADAWRAAPAAGLANGRFGAQSWNTGNPLQVRGIQTALDALGYDPGIADGVLGPRTADAIRSFQRAEGLAVTGTVTPQLIDQLNAGATGGRG